MKKLLILFFIIVGIFGCKIKQKELYLDESKVQNIAVTSPLADRKSEISSLAWYNDYLIILPQYPSRFVYNGTGSLFAISKKQLDDYFADESKKSIKPIQIPFFDNGLSSIEGFEGYEAIAFIKDEVYLTIESSPNKMLGFLVKGKILNDLSKIEMSKKTAEIQPQADIPNACYETMFAYNNNLVVIYEANGKNVNPNPKALIYNSNLRFVKDIEFPNIEYRITDATSLYEDKFYVINYFWPGDAQAYNPANDEIKEKYGYGKTHSENKNVERIIELKISDKISFVNKPPTYLKLMGNNTARNWEGIVRYKKGFILATDKYPKTIIAYIEQK